MPPILCPQPTLAVTGDVEKCLPFIELGAYGTDVADSKASGMGETRRHAAVTPQA